LLKTFYAFDATAIFINGCFKGVPFNYPATTAGFLGVLWVSGHASNATATRDYVLLTAGLTGTTQPGIPTSNTIGVTYPWRQSNSEKLW
jgi:hypothetical protein